MKYNFLKMNEKTVFDAKLRNEVVDFGFIPFWRMGRFLNFCTKYGFLHQPEGWRYGAYRVNHKFSYVYSGCHNIRHMPLGRILEWISDLFCDPKAHHTFNGKVQRCHHEVTPRMNHDKKFPDAVDAVWSNGLIL